MQNPHSVLLYLRPAPIGLCAGNRTLRAYYSASLGPAFELARRQRPLQRRSDADYGLARDNPTDVGPTNCRYDACIEVSAEFEDRAIRDLGLATLPGGAYACSRLTGGYDRIRSVVSNVYSEFQPFPGLGIDEGRPVVTIYVDNPNYYKESDLRADICMPVTALDQFVTPQTAVAA